jgi:hypothetical protein
LGRVPAHQHGAYTREYRPQITREIIDPEPGQIVIASRKHFLYLTGADGAAIMLLE